MVAGSAGYRISFISRSILLFGPAEAVEFLERTAAPFYKVARDMERPGRECTLTMVKMESLDGIAASPDWAAEGQSRTIRHYDGKATLFEKGARGALRVTAPPIRMEWDSDPVTGEARYEFIYGTLTASVLMELFRMVRGCLQDGLAKEGYLKLHCALLGFSDKTVCFVGNSGAGKTSFLLSCLLNREGSAFITNDKAFAAVSRNAPLTFHGCAYAISVCGPIALANPVFRSDREIGGEYYHWPRNLARKASFPIATRGINPVFCLVEFRLGEELRILRLDSGSEKFAILTIMLNCPDRMIPIWLPGSGDRITANEDAMEFIKQAIEADFYRITGDPWLHPLDFEMIGCAASRMANPS